MTRLKMISTHLDAIYEMSIWRNRPIRDLILYGALLIAAIVVGTAIAVGEFRNRAINESQRELQNTAFILSEQIDRLFQGIALVQTSVVQNVQSLGITSSEQFTRQMSGQGVQLMLKDSISGLAHVDAITLVNADGELLNSSRGWPIVKANLADRDYFKALKADAQLTSFISLPEHNRITGAWTLFRVRKLMSANGEFLGLVIGAVELSYFDELFGSLILGAYSSISLSRGDGILLTRYPPIESNIGKPFSPSINALGDSDSGTVRYSPRGGKDRLLAAHRLVHFPLLVSVAVEADAALAHWREETKVFLGVAGLASLATAIAILLIVRQLTIGHKLSSQRLALEKSWLDTAVNNIPLGMVLFDSSDQIVICNRRYIDMYGLATDVVKPGCTLFDLLCHRKATGSLLGDVYEYHSDLLEKLALEITWEFISENADGRAIRIVIQPVVNGGWVTTHEDVTERIVVEQERDRNRDFLNQIIDQVPTAIIVKNANDLRYVLVNKAGESFFGAPSGRMLGKTAHEIWSQVAADVIVEQDEKLLKSDGYLIFDEHQFVTPGRGSRTITAKRLIIRDGNGKPQYLVGVIEDVTERKIASERIAHLAHYDALTDLPNRVLFREYLEQSLKWVQRGGKIAILYVDVDQFKTVNDSFGHTVGDELLKIVADRLRACLGEADIVARLGGDEFAIIQTAIGGPADVIELVTRIQTAIGEPCEVGGYQLLTDASVGIALAPDDGIESDKLLKNADLAMYSAKADGRRTYRFFEPGMDTRVKARRILEMDMRQSMIDGGFEVYYQPVVDLRSNQVSGCEALLRWHHPQRGMISPAEFIPVAEETGLIGQLGEWVLTTACAEAAKWPGNIKLAVNVSPIQFRSDTLALKVVAALVASGLSPERLELEITEAVLIRDADAPLAILHQLRSVGVRIALDDFGTGYSSLSYLQRFPFDKIKIDRCFVTDIAEPNGSSSIVQAVVNIAASRNMTTTAEGVETEEQKALLSALGCTEMQGYLFSPAKPAADIRQLLFSGCQKLGIVA
jgi:diguanylate cyclase (GGDEF)-like protein/PAS domain S-box-containing protein